MRNTIAGIPAPPRDLEHFEHVVQADGSIAAPPRSSRWPAVQRAHLRANPTCAACGKTRTWQGVRRGWRRNEVHHLEPFHLRPHLELDPANLLTLCREQHFRVGHAGNWTAYNPTAARDAAALLALVRLVPRKRTRRLGFR